MNIMTQLREYDGSGPDRKAIRTQRGHGSRSRKGKESPAATVARVNHERLQRIFLRGTNLLPPGTRVQPCVAGSKQSILVDTLARPEGATMEELLEALSGGRRPWTEATVRSGFGWDLKRKGYGVRSEFDPTGEERFHLLLPRGQKIPPHVTAAEARRSKSDRRRKRRRGRGS